MRVEPDEAGPSLARWPLLHPRLAGRLAAGARNISLLVEASDGSRYVLRGYRRNPRRDWVIFQLDFQDQLRRGGVPVPQVVLTESGERCVENGPGSLWVMFRFVDGHHYLTEAERRALPYFTVAVQARTAARYRVREREGTDPRQALRTHVRRMQQLSAAIG